MARNNEQFSNERNPLNAPPEPPAGYDSADDVEWEGYDTTSNPANLWSADGAADEGYEDTGADSADDAGEQNPWAGAQPAQTRGTYEPNRRNPDAALGITTQTKIGWIALGFFLGIFAPIIAYLLYQNREPELRMTAFRHIIIGLILGVIVELMLLGMLGALDITQMGGGATSEGAGWTSTTF